MTHAVSTQAAALPSPSRSGALAAFIETTKPRITRLVTITSGVGFALAALSRPGGLAHLVVPALGCLAGTVASAAGANALNQWAERERDARMPRTCARPLPQSRLSPRAVLWPGLACCAAGVVTLWLACGKAPALVSLATILIYLLVYTPMKPLTPLATLVGAVPGALPPLIGWTAASPDAGLASLSHPGGWSLFLIMFVWQIPHFLAIAWLYRRDYALGGHAVLPVVDPAGGSTAAAVLVWAACLVPITLAPVLVVPSLGWAYMLVAGITGTLFFVQAARLALSRTAAAARRTFIASVIHLPVLLLAMVADAAASLLR